MNKFIAVTKEPLWIKRVGILLLFPGFIALIPFKAAYLQLWDVPFFSFTAVGILLLLRAIQRIGWRINLEDNVLYYSKFNLYSNWKKRRSQEYALSSEKMSKVTFEGKRFVISYHPSKKLHFNTQGLSSLSFERLEKLKLELEAQISRQNA
jgi:hypothetical protein